MRALDKFVFGSLVGAGILALSAVGASAAIVCSGNACWHVKNTYNYPSEARVVVHKDDWKWRATISTAGGSMRAAAIGTAING